MFMKKTLGRASLCLLALTCKSSLAFNYGEALQKSIFFYEAQQSGKLPDWNRVSWRGDSTLSDGSDVGHDLTGGWFDAGDHVKFGLPMAFTATMLSLGVIEYPEAYTKSKQMEHIKNNLRFVADYFVKAHTAPYEFYGQVGAGGPDHAWWGSAEVINMARPSFKVDKNCPGSEVTGETAAALSAIAIIFKKEDPEYASKLIRHARQLFTFAEEYRGNYTECITDAQSYYNSFSGYKDELVWSAIWLYRATGEKEYLDFAKENYHTLNNKAGSKKKSYLWTLAWDDKAYGVYVLMSKLLGEKKYMDDAERWLDYWTSGYDGERIPYTPGGLAYLDSWGATRYAANTSFMALLYSDYLASTNSNSPKVKLYHDFAVSQIEYILGKNPLNLSYQIGYSSNSPKNPHHRTAHGTWTNNLTSPKESRHLLIGALVGGPNQDDSYEDDRGNFINNEVATDYNSGFTSAVARLYLEYGGEPIDSREFPPIEAPSDEYFIEAKINSEGPRHLELSTIVHNHSAWPAQVNDNLHFRYWMDLTEVIEAGYSPSDIEVSSAFSSASSISDLIPWNDGGDQIYYIDVSFAGVDIYPGGLSESKAEVQFRISLPRTSNQPEWDFTNDPSWDNYSASYIRARKIALYAGNKLVWGEEPTNRCGGNTGLNCAPQAESFAVMTKVNQSTNIKLLGTDRDGEVIGYKILKDTVSGTLTLQGNRVTYTPSIDFTGTDLFQYAAIDNAGSESQPATVSIEVYDPFTPNLTLQSPGENEIFYVGSDIEVEFQAKNIKKLRVEFAGKSYEVKGSTRKLTIKAPMEPGKYNLVVLGLKEDGTELGIQERVSVEIKEGEKGLTCSVSSPSTWDGGFVIRSIKVTNSSNQTINGWEVHLRFDTHVSITNSWNASIKPAPFDNAFTARNVEYNGTLKPNESAKFGLQGEFSGVLNPPECHSVK